MNTSSNHLDRPATVTHTDAADDSAVATGRVARFRTRCGRYAGLATARRSPGTRRRSRKGLALLVAATVSGALASGTTASADSWVFYDGDQVNQALTFGRTEALRMKGSVNWYYASSNSNNRLITVGVTAYQSTNYVPLCIGVQMMIFRQSRQTTVGGQVEAGWSLAGPSVSAGATYSRTTSSGSTSDGIFWRCPQGGRYVPGGTSMSWQENLHPQFGLGTHVAFRACLATSPTGPERWCTAWDVNAFGGS